MSRKTGVAAAFVLVVAAIALYLVHPTEVTLGIAVASAIPLVWMGVSREGPPGSSPPGPWSGP